MLDFAAVVVQSAGGDDVRLIRTSQLKLAPEQAKELFRNTRERLQQCIQVRATY